MSDIKEFEDWWGTSNASEEYSLAKEAFEYATKAEREWCAQLMEKQHTWITAVAAANLIRNQ